MQQVAGLKTGAIRIMEDELASGQPIIPVPVEAREPLPFLSQRQDALGHAVQFYECDEVLIDRLSEFAGTALEAARSCVIVAAPEHRASLAEALIERGLDIPKLIAAGRFIALDAAALLEQFMVHDGPSQVLFQNVVGRVLDKAFASQGRHGHVAVFGEMVALLLTAEKRDAALKLEKMWNELARQNTFHLLCAYPMRAFSRREDAAFFGEICAEHTHVAPCESYSGIADESQKLLAISELQQKAHTLETELARREKAEAALRKSEEFAQRIVESSVDCIKVLDTEGRIIYMSPPGQRALDIADVNEILTRPWADFWDDADRARAWAAVETAKAGGVGRFEGPLTIKGAVTWWDVKITPMLHVDGSVDRLLAISRENTELRLAHTALMQSEKLAMVGKLAATVAHEINNPLEAVTNFVYLARMSPGLPEEVGRGLEIADQELARVAAIAQQTLGFYRDTSNPQNIPLAELMRSVISVYDRKLKSKKLQMELQLDETVSILARKGDLKQVLCNLLTNAIDAASLNGRIVLRVRRSHHRQSNAQGVRITMADNGMGMDTETRKKAFAAFFTTKAEIGTGIGLWVTKNLLERDGGSIACRSRKGERSGTVMSIYLPLQV
ncbi:MAG: MEDS domain-containing protein [Acidobacteria bacterium]|nr:MEDS domain-containing protein [Acidobacteriota bacterium]